MSDKTPQGTTVFSGRKVELRLVDVPLSDGGTLRRELVVHPGAVLVLGLLSEDEVVMIRNRRFAVGADLWELPAGTLEPPEPPETCAIREMREETGYQPGRVEFLGKFYTTPGFCNELIHVYVARDLSYVGQDLEPFEDIAVEVLGWDRLRAMMLDGEIADAKTIAALSLYLMGRNRV